MALTPEVIKANESLSDLTEDQVAAISTLSVNDENTVISAKIGEIHGQYDKDVEEITGMKRPDGTKTYDFVKQTLTDYKTKVAGSADLQTKITGYETEISTLKQQIADGKGNEVVAQQLKDAQGKLTQLQTQYDTDKQTWEKEKGEFASKITGIQVNSEFGKATSALKFKAGYPEGVQQTLLKSAKDGILNQYKPDWVEADGKKVMVFRDDKGEILRNKNNALNPYTAQELITEQLKDVLDQGKKTTGTGTGDPGKGGDKIEIVDIAGAKNQVEADDIITKYLMQQGETRGSQSFADKQKKLRADNGVDKLPIR